MSQFIERGTQGGAVPVNTHLRADGGHMPDVGQFGTSTMISTATTTTIAAGRVAVKSIRVVAGTMGLVTIYRGAITDPQHLSVTPAKNDVLVQDSIFDLGLTIVTAALTIIEVITIPLGAE